MEALPDHHVDFDLGDIEPTAVLGGVDEFKAILKHLGFRGFEGIVECTGTVRVEIVHHQRDSGGIGVLRGDVTQEVSPVGFGPAFGHFGEAPASQWFGSHEYIAGAEAPVFVVLPRRSSRGGWDRAARLADQLAWSLVHAHHRKLCIIRTPIEVKHSLHCGGEIGIVLGGNHPTLASPRLEVVFFSTRRTVSCDTLSI